MSAWQTPPTGGPQPLRPDFRQRAHSFWDHLTEGMAAEQLWQQFKAEAREGYSLYSGEVDWSAIHAEKKKWKRPFLAAWALFRGLLMKLTPARRVLLVLAVVLLLIQPEFHFGRTNVSFQMGGLGATILFLLLALELADRVTMKRDLEIAREIQRMLVPAHPPHFAGLDIAFATRPANTVAGDYYDVFLRHAPDAPGAEKSIFMVVADVAGKSVPAALLMATFQAGLHTLAAVPGPLLHLVRGLDAYACMHSLGGSRFTTAFFAELNPATRELVYVNAGHNSPVLQRALDGVERLTDGGLPLGIPIHGDTKQQYVSGSTQLASGDLLLIFTDGLVEAENAAAGEFGEERMLHCLGSVRGLSADETLRRLMHDVDAFVGSTRQHDDITCLVLRIL